MSIKFADMARFLWRERMESVMDCERSVITMTLLRLDYLVYSLGNCVDDTSTETGLTGLTVFFGKYVLDYFWLVKMMGIQWIPWIPPRPAPAWIQTSWMKLVLNVCGILSRKTPDLIRAVGKHEREWYDQGQQDSWALPMMMGLHHIRKPSNDEGNNWYRHDPC